MTKPCSATSGFRKPRPAPLTRSWRRNRRFSENRSVHFPSIFRQNYKPSRPSPMSATGCGRSRGQTLDMSPTTKDRLSFCATAALADFHRLVLREHSDRWSDRTHFRGGANFRAPMSFGRRGRRRSHQAGWRVAAARLRIVREPVRTPARATPCRGDRAASKSFCRGRGHDRVLLRPQDSVRR